MSILRGLAIPIGAVVAILLFVLFNPWLVVEPGTLRQVLTVAFWVAFIVLLVALFEVAGYYGVDRYLLPRLGTPWRPGALFLRRQAGPASG